MLSVQDAGAEVLGISSDAPEANAAFAKAQRLPFPLLSDTGSEVRKALGIKGDLFGLVPGRQVGSLRDVTSGRFFKCMGSGDAHACTGSDSIPVMSSVEHGEQCLIMESLVRRPSSLTRRARWPWCSGRSSMPRSTSQRHRRSSRP